MTMDPRDETSTGRPADGPTGTARQGRALWRGFRRREDGSVAIEFSLLVIPFTLMVFAVLESCLSFAGQQILASAVDDMARQFRTGQVRPADLVVDPGLVRDKICARIEIVVTTGCPGLEVDLKSYDTFAEAAAIRTRFTENGDIDTTGFGIVPGKSGSKNQLRVFYRWPVMTDLARKAVSNLPEGKTLLFASVTWQNEPFDD